MALAYTMLKNAAVAPPWIEADKDARRLVDDRDRLLERAARASSPGTQTRTGGTWNASSRHTTRPWSASTRRRQPPGSIAGRWSSPTSSPRSSAPGRRTTMANHVPDSSPADRAIGEELADWGTVLLLETRGRTSGAPLTVAVGYIEEPDGSLLGRRERREQPLGAQSPRGAGLPRDPRRTHRRVPRRPPRGRSPQCRDRRADPALRHARRTTRRRARLPPRSPCPAPTAARCRLGSETRSSAPLGRRPREPCALHIRTDDPGPSPRRGGPSVETT